MIAFLLSLVLAAQDLPQHGDGPINDFAGEIDKETYAKIEKAIAALRSKADARLVVATVPTLQGLTVEEYALKLTKKWGVGEKGKNNGILLLHAPKERKIRIENGYGVESRLTDIEAKGVINGMVPLMKNGKFAAALLQAVESISEIMTRPEKVEEKQNSVAAPPQKSSDSPAGIWIIMGMMGVVLTAIFLIIWLQSRPIRFEPSKPVERAPPPPPDPFAAGLASAALLASQLPPTPRSTTPYRPFVPDPSYSPPPPRKRRRDDDDDDSSSRRSSSSFSSDFGSSSSSSDSSSSSSSDSGSYGGGDSGGGGASGDY